MKKCLKLSCTKIVAASKVPITPLHLGPGALIKSAIPKWFSFRAFLITQIAIDTETAWNIFRGHRQLHALFHSYIGVAIPMFMAAVVMALYNIFARRRPNSWVVRELEHWGNPFELRSSVIGVCIGGWSHIFLDSIMHSDMLPIHPFSNSNSLLDLISADLLHELCLLSFLAAALVWGLRLALNKMRRQA